MPNLLTRLILLLYPSEFRDRFGAQIEADVACLRSPAALANLLGAAFVYRLKSPAPYIGAAACLIALSLFAGAAAGIPRVPRIHAALANYIVMFGAVFFVLFATLFLSVFWLQCSKSKI
ncbi:MAG: hypothetical protein FJW30_01865 [Acidobacteria bacterium]|nr:hypothetical protein [Acidobacteriota bacterium]